MYGCSFDLFSNLKSGGTTAVVSNVVDVVGDSALNFTLDKASAVTTRVDCVVKRVSACDTRSATGVSRHRVTAVGKSMGRVQSINGCRTAVAAMALARALPLVSQLQRLHLDSNDVGVARARAVASALHSVPQQLLVRDTAVMQE
jgi:hypothetical protein